MTSDLGRDAMRVLIALDDEDREDPYGPTYPSVIGIARDLVNKTISLLDSVTLRASLSEETGARIE